MAGRAAAAILEPRGGSRHRPRGGRGGPHALLRPGDHRALRHRLRAHGPDQDRDPAGLLALGAFNSRAMRRMDGARRRRQATCAASWRSSSAWAHRALRRRLADLAAPRGGRRPDRATFAEVATRFTPRLPTLTSPRSTRCRSTIRAPPAPTPTAPGPSSTITSPACFVLAMGVLAIACTHRPGARGPGTGRSSSSASPPSCSCGTTRARGRSAREGFWEGMPSSRGAAAPHLRAARAGLRDLRVDGAHRTDALARAAALVFPLLCAVGRRAAPDPFPRLAESQGGVPPRGDPRAAGGAGDADRLGALARAAAARARRRVPGSLWAVGLALIGVLLIIYRES